MIADRQIAVGDIAVDREGNLIATAAGAFRAAPDALIANSCASGVYLKTPADGEQVFATYLPTGTSYEVDGTSDRGLPVLRGYGGYGVERFQVREAGNMGVFTGCVVDAGSFQNWVSISPGAIVTLFGSAMGPREGVAFRLQSGRVPTTLGGVRVLVDGEAVPLLYVSANQINAILPYSLRPGSRPAVQVIRDDGQAGNVISGSSVQHAGISIFRAGDSPLSPAAALNQDGSVNGPQNPARPGSVISLFGTGGGATTPPSNAGEITTLTLRPTDLVPEVWIVTT